jgi:hypothetical protein
MSTYAKRIGVVSLKQKIENPSETKFEYLYQAIGLNTGNFMFTNAVFKQIEADLLQIGFSFNPDKINKEFDALVVPAANWINERTDWTWLIELLEKINIPVITIGIGLQANSTDIDKVRVNESSMRLIKLLSNKSKWISCRGDFTRDWMGSVGIKNTVTTGCPSLYMKLEGQYENQVDGGEVILQGTRYWVSTEFNQSNDINRNIYAMAGRLNLPMIYQSEAEEIDYLVYSESRNDQHAKNKKLAFANLYGFTEYEDVINYISVKGHVFFDIDKWSEFVKNNVGVIGTRLHGAIIALNSGKPARLITHDSRTQEIADFAEIPTIPESLVLDLNEADARRILNDTDLSRYIAKRKVNSNIYVGFLEDCGLLPNYQEIITVK